MLRTFPPLLLGPLLATACFGGSSTSTQTSTSSQTCNPSPVHYDKNSAFIPSLRTLPYVESSAAGQTLVGHLFYYNAVPAWRGHRPSDFRIFPGGRMDNTNLNMKILWTLTGQPASVGLTVNGIQTDTGAHLSTQQFPGGTEFPSIIDVPTTGCWHLSLSTGSVTTHLTVLAVKPLARP